MRYMSTRGEVRNLPFKDAVMMGLAEDGGLLLPETIPALTPGDVEALAKLAYPELAFQIISLFAGDIPSVDLKELVDRSYAAFGHPETTPVVHRNGLYITRTLPRPHPGLQGCGAAVPRQSLRVSAQGTRAEDEHPRSDLRRYRQRRHLRGARQGEHQYFHSAPAPAGLSGAGTADDHGHRPQRLQSGDPGDFRRRAADRQGDLRRPGVQGASMRWER